MTQESPDLEKINKELGFYKSRVDELAGENLKLDYAVSGLRHELKQKRVGFNLLSTLQQSLGLQPGVAEILEKTAQAINGNLGMDKTIVFVPGESELTFVPSLLLGFAGAEEATSTVPVLFPENLVKQNEILIANKATAVTPFIQLVRDQFKLPYFVCISVQLEGNPIALFISGRLREAKPLYPPLDQGDGDTLQAISGLISATIQSMKVAALKETDRLKTDFFANISHEFRTPITLTIGPLEAMLAGRYGSVDEKVRIEAERMLRNQKRLLSLINQILDLAKLESGAMNLKASRTKNMNHFVQKRVDQFQSLVEKKGLQLKVEFDPAVDQSDIYIDYEKMDKVVFNLLSNACKFTKHGHIKVISKIKDNLFYLSVEDTGIGIKSDQILQVFDRFKQADGSASREYAGTGIGLSLVKEVIELHGGKVAVRSEYGKGTTFEFSFPVGHAHLPTDFISNETEQEDQDASNTTRQVVDLREGKASEADLQEVNARNKQVENSRDPYKPTLLYVDDNKDLREFVSGILASQYNLFLGVNGRHGLEAALNYAPDLILSDLMMPEMNGGEFLKAAKENVFLSSIPFVILTAKLGSESKISELERGADDYLNKPFSEAELVARLSNLIKIRTQQQRIKKDLIAARQIQQSLLPPAQLHLDSCELEVLYHPCEELSGDFFDIYETPDFIYYYVADVTSHGTAAAQVTYLVKGLFENQVMNSNDLDLKQLLGNIAKKYVAYNLEYAVGIQMVKLHKKSKLLEYSSSNAPSAYLLSKAKKPETIFVDPGPALWTKNYSPDREFSIKPIQLAPGDSFFCFTDGVYEFEMENGKEFGERRLQMALQKSLVEPKWTECLMEDLRKATGGSQFPDDITAVRLKIKN